jgi:hypothetical protein
MPLTRYCMLRRVVRIVPGIDGVAGVNRRDRWQLQLYGIAWFLLEQVLSLGTRFSVGNVSRVYTR